MSPRLVVGIGGGRAARLEEVARAVEAELATSGGNLVSAYDYAAPERPRPGAGSYPAPPDRPESFDAMRFFAELGARSAGPGEPLVAVLGPLSALPAARASCGLIAFVEVEERLALLRWADILMEAGAPGGVEALLHYESSIAPAYASWSAEAARGADLTLDDEEGPAALGSKIAYLARSLERGSASARGRSPADVAEAGIPRDEERRGGSREARERIAAARALEERLRGARPPSRLGLALRALSADKLYPAAKRCIDIGLVSLVLFVAWPIYALVALLVWADDPGPVIYVQRRVGKHGRIFPFPKFRSMVVDADRLKDRLLARNEMTGGITFKMKRDPRVIPIGRVMRRFSLDELPQLWSVLRGDLTLVGPRPPVPREVALYTSSDRRRLEATPGLTCIWQVSGRSDIPFPRQVELDVEYLERRSLVLDLRILMATIPAVVTGKGAY